MANIVQYKLVTQEWVVGDQQDLLESRDHIYLKQPLVIHLVPQGPQNYTLALAPYNPADPEGEVKIYKSAIISEPTKVPKSLHDAYVRQTSTIEIVSALDGIK